MIREEHSDWQELLERARRKEAPAINSLLTRLAVTLRPILQYRLRGWSREDQEDILQETLITFAGKLDTVESRPHHYAAAILRNKIGDALRARRGKTRVSLDRRPEHGSSAWHDEIEFVLSRQSHADDVQSKLERGEAIRRIQQALKQLSLFCQAFFLGIMEGKDMAEMWELFKVAEPQLQRNALRKRVFDCRLKLKDLLQEAV